MKKIIYAFFFLSLTSSCSQNLDELICNITDINVLEHKHIGIGGWKGKNYTNFEVLTEKATINQLLELLQHDNPVVACYASWALIDKNYNKLPDVFKLLIKDKRTIKTQSGCIISSNSLSSAFYHRYWNKHKTNVKDDVLLKLDETILNQDKPNWLLLTRALKNRTYKNKYKKIIYDLGFKKNYIEAIFYLCNWHRAEYNYELQLYLIEDLKKTKFQGKNSSEYFKYMNELVRFNNEKLHDFILYKYQNDPPNIYQIEKFKKLLDENYIFD